MMVRLLFPICDTHHLGCAAMLPCCLDLTCAGSRDDNRNYCWNRVSVLIKKKKGRLILKPHCLNGK